MSVFGRNRDYYYTQTNNPTEVALKSYGAKNWLVSCGPTSMINCLASMGYKVDVRSLTGKWTFQPEELVMDFLIDPRNVPKLNAIRDVPADFSKQEVPQYYPYAASVLFGATARYGYGVNLENIQRHLRTGGTVQICLKTPGHYLAVVNYEPDPSGTLDPDKGQLIYNDSWPGRHEDGNGFNRSMGKEEFEANVKNYAIWYDPIR